MPNPLEEKGIRWVVLTTAVLAVFAAITFLKGESYSTRVQLLTTAESNKWAQYQLKSIRQHLYELQRDLFQLESLMNHVPEAQKFLDAKQVEYEEAIKRYDFDKNLFKKQAEGVAEEENLLKRKGAHFSTAVMFLQIAILLSSASVLLKKRALWLTGLLFGTIALIYFLNGVYLFM